MNILAVEIKIPFAVDVHSTEDTLTVDLSDGRTIQSHWVGTRALSMPAQRNE